MKLFDKIKGAFDPKDEYAEDEFDGYGNDDGFGDDEYEPEYTQNTNNAAPAPKANRGMGLNSGALEMKVVKPDKYDSQTAQKIADHLLSNRTVVLNLESTNKESARRLIDFLSGVAYAQDGKIKKISSGTYIITPYNVNLMGDLMDELESSGVYF